LREDIIGRVDTGIRIERIAPQGGFVRSGPIANRHHLEVWPFACSFPGLPAVIRQRPHDLVPVANGGMHSVPPTLSHGAADTAKIRAPLLLHYASLDERVNAGWPAFEAALKANGIKYQAYRYQGEPRLSQRQDAALQRSRRQARVVAHHRVPE
jgi:dienelactone hydrolase